MILKYSVRPTSFHTSEFERQQATLIALGDPKASEWLLKEYTDLVYKICYRGSQRGSLLSPCEEVEDIVEQVFEEILTDISEFNGTCTLEQWVQTRARRVVWRRIGKQRRHQKILYQRWGTPLSGNDGGLISDSEDHSQQHPEHLLIMKENQAALKRGISALSDRQQRVIFLLLEGAAYRDIASILDISQDAVATLIYRIRKKLLGILTRQGYG